MTVDRIDSGIIFILAVYAVFHCIASIKCNYEPFSGTISSGTSTRAFRTDTRPSEAFNVGK